MTATPSASRRWWERWRRRRAPVPGNLVEDAADDIRDPDNLVELAGLERMIRRSDGFRIAFAVANHPALQERLADVARRDLPDVMITDLTVGPHDAGRIVAAIEDAAQPPVHALFVRGLGELGSARARARVVTELNLNRDHLWREVPVPVVLWAPDFAVREFAQHATDLWSGRSGVYRFRPEGGDIAETATEVASGISWGHTPEERREREMLLRELLEELDETGDDPAARVRLLTALGDAAGMQDRYTEAQQRYQQALPTYREIGDRLGEANTLLSLGDTARMQNRYAEAEQLYQQALPTYREIGSRVGEANTLRSLADTALAQDRYAEAEQLNQQALPTYREIGDRLGEANTLLSLGDTARMQNRYAEAEQRYQHALSTYREIGDRLGEANTLKSLADTALAQDRYAEAEQRYQQALCTYREIGSRFGEANTLKSLADTALAQDRYAEAEQLNQQALATYREIGSRAGEADTLLGLGRALLLTDAASAAGTLEDAARIYRLVGLSDRAEEAERLAAGADTED